MWCYINESDVTFPVSRVVKDSMTEIGRLSAGVIVSIYGKVPSRCVSHSWEV